MVAQSRFGDFYEKWKDEEKIELLNEMARLIEKNSAYADRNNYAHMCNLITSLAMIIVLEKAGKRVKKRKKKLQTPCTCSYSLRLLQCRSSRAIHGLSECLKYQCR